MAAAPLEGRIHPAAVWTGHELIVVGGYRDDVAQPGESVDAFTSDGRQLPLHVLRRRRGVRPDHGPVAPDR